MLRANLGPLIVFVVLCAAAYTLPSYFVFLAISGIAQILLLLSLGVIVGRAGLISLGQLAFAGIGAWCASWVALNASFLPFAVQLVAGAAGAAFVGAIVALPSMRVRGINLGALTLAFAVAVQVVFNVVKFPGADSFTPIPRPDALFDDRLYMIVVAGIACAVAVILNVLDSRGIGATWQAIRFSERATANAGRSVATAKLTAFAVSAAIAGLGGAVIAFQIGQVSPRNFEPLAGLILFAAAIFTGSRYFTGAVIGGVLFIAIPEFLRRFDLPLDIETAIFAVGAILTLRGGKTMAEALHGLLPKRKPQPVDAEPPALIETERMQTLKVSDLTVRFGAITALDNVSIEIDSGVVTGLIGPNGAGKSTFIDAVSGFLPQAEGNVVLQGRDIMGVSVHRRARTGLRRTFQQGRAVPDLTIRQLMQMSTPHHLTREQADGICAFLDCPPADTVIAEVDVGTRRILEIAAALAANPKVLLLDEPAAGLSHFESEALGRRIREIPHRFGCGVLLIEHDIALVRQCCDALTVLEFGQIIAQGPTEAVLADPKVVEAYLGHADVKEAVA